MKLVFFTVIGSAFISLASSIHCYQCVPEVKADSCSSYTSDQCVKHQIKVICPEGFDFCMRSRLHNASVDIEKRSCASSKTCGSAKEYCEQGGTNQTNVPTVTCKWWCCDKDLCNASVHPIAQCLMLVVLACLFALP